jgi:hypothetical protein
MTYVYSCYDVCDTIDTYRRTCATQQYIPQTHLHASAHDTHTHTHMTHTHTHKVCRGLGRPLPVESTELDEFGRDPSFARERRAKEYADRRARSIRRKKEGGVAGGVGVQKDEELLTTDESDSVCVCFGR